MGIVAVIAVLAIGKGASAMTVKEISSMSNNLVLVRPDWEFVAQFPGPAPVLRGAPKSVEFSS
jgi:hypothetical protein